MTGDDFKGFAATRKKLRKGEYFYGAACAHSEQHEQNISKPNTD